MTTPEDDEPTPDELREAEALARALERGHAPPGTPEDALAAAAFLRYAKDGGALGEDRAQAILEDALARARPPATVRRRWRWFGVLGLAAAGALAALFVARPGGPDPALPAPPRALLEAELGAASGHLASLDALGAETRSYRSTVYASLSDRYGR